MQRARSQTTDPIAEMWSAFRKFLHGTALFAILVLLLIVFLDMVVLAWSWWPVSEGAMRIDSYSVLFIIAPHPVGETAINGLQAVVLGAILFMTGLVLYAIKRSGRFPGLGGGGTTFTAATAIVSGGGLVAQGAYLAATGGLSDPTSVPNVLPSPMGLMVVRFSILAQWHSIMMGAIFMSFAAMLYIEGPSFLGTLRSSLKRATLPSIRTDNAIIMVPRLYLGIVGLNVVYTIILYLFTVQQEVPDFEAMPLWEQLHAFAEASVWEEVLTRVLLLGVPLMIYHVLTGRPERNRWRYLVGGGMRIDSAAFVLIVLQGLVFALAHVAGWDLWKVLPTVISGIAFGYLFLKKGLWAAIMLHFTFDYLGMTAPAFAQWGLQVDSAMSVAYLFLSITGLVVLVHYLVIIVREGPAELREALTGRPAGTTPDGNP
jgi:hypothetical protein